MSMKFHSSQSFQSGQAALVAVVVISLVVLTVTIGAGVVSVTNQRIVRNIAQSAQAYFLAEAGMEDSLLRVIDLDMDYQASNTITLSGNSATITIGQTGKQISVTSEGDVNSRVRAVSNTLEKSTTETNFFYGVQVGEGGLEIRHLDGKVVGNVYANGTSFGSGTVTESMVVAGDGNELQDLNVNGDVLAYTCDNATIGGDLIYNENGSNGCTVAGSTSTQPDSIEQIDFPITDAQIAEWKAEAVAGGTLSGNQTISADQILGPVKIDGNLYIDNNVTVTLNGTVWITGTYDNGNNAIVQLDESYGSESGIFLADGNVQLRNNVIMRGTSDPDSYIMVVGDSPSEDENDAAIDVKNNLDGAILFASDGLMVVHNNVSLVEAMAHKMLIQKADVSYESGLANINFWSGPAGGWDITSWVEVE